MSFLYKINTTNRNVSLGLKLWMCIRSLSIINASEKSHSKRYIYGHASKCDMYTRYLGVPNYYKSWTSRIRSRINRESLLCQSSDFSTSALNNVGKIIYKTHGNPIDVMEVVDDEVGIDINNLEREDVVVEMLAAPINPSDVNQIEGVYAVQPPLPAVGGNEGVGVVASVGEGVNDLKIGDWVIPTQAGCGTWQTVFVCKQNELCKIRHGVPVEYAATIKVNPCTAYRMLSDFVDLKPNDIVIQNGATSVVGRSVIQIAKARGIKTINLIRDRPSFDEVEKELKGLGADVVVCENTIKSKKDLTLLLEQISPHASKPILGLNCVGGSSSSTILRALEKKATMVTYGGMSKRPVMVSTSDLIFKDVTVKGFWMTRWAKENSAEKSQEMFNDLFDMIERGQLQFEFNKWDYKQVGLALESLQHKGAKKNLLMFK